MKIRTLKQKILISVSLALACAVLLLSGFAYYNTRQQLLSDGFQQLQSLAHEGSQNIGGWLEIKRQAVRALTTQSQIESARELALTKQANGFLAVYLGDEQGGMRDENPKSDYSDYDPRTRPWYQQAKQQGDMITTAPYIDVTTKEMVITLAKPVANGVVGADLTITTVLNTVNELKLPASGFAILADRQGQIIAYSDKEKVLQPLTSLDSNLTPSFVNQLKQSNGLTPITWQGASKLIWACDVPHSDWQLLFVLDADTLFAPLKSDLWQQVVIAVLVLFGSL
ncbi:MAG: cache domain-containing protein, partial [Aeromonadaceae bacterium]